jgi:4-aminobutyrate aminotransferase-like enzyme/Ser/Thr protein kinase RdoA (MazF antagonist)
MESELVKEIARKHWNLEGKIKALAGYEDFNFLFATNEGQKYLVKISKGEFSPNIDFQIKAMQFASLKIKNHSLTIPNVVSTTEGKTYLAFNYKNEKYIYRIHSWVSGKLWVDYKPKSDILLADLGFKSALLLQSLTGFNHPAMIKKGDDWDLCNSLWIEKRLEILDSEVRDIVGRFIEQFKGYSDIYYGLPKAVIHNDINDYNIIVHEGAISGFIDFGDMCYTQRINDLGILLAYAMMEQNDPLDAAFQIIKEYVKVVALSEEELNCVYILAGMRLSVSITSAAINLKKNPENVYLQVTNAPGIKLLKKLSEINFNFAKYKLREATGFTPILKAGDFQIWKDKNKGKWSKVCPLDILSNDYHILDLGIGSQELGHECYFNNARNHESQINSILALHGKSFAIGQYDEVRPLYSSNDFVNIGNNGNRWRTVHIGLDFFHKAGTEVYAFFKGVVHSLKYNLGDKNYGNTVILRHESDELRFFTLYGHLSSKTLDHLELNQKVETGDLIGWFGQPEENGNWAPHLHFQIILDLLGNVGDFPGVAYFHERKLYKSICPDPTALFGIHKKNKVASRKEDILNKRKHYLGRSYSISYKDHLHIERAHMQFLYDEKGRKFLDCVNNVPHVGHQNIQVIEAGQRQMALLNTNTRYLHDNIVQLAETLVSKLPDKLKVCHFVNSGSEANELAIRMARTFTGRNDIIAMKHGYHGNTNLCVDISSYKFEGKGGFRKKDYVHLLDLPDPFRGNHKGENIASIYSKNAVVHIDEISSKRGIPAAFICESILSCGGQLCFPNGYLKDIYENFRSRGIVLIADEVQLGLGRVGSKMWAFENEGVIPDIVTIGKPFGNGHPLGAVICTEEIADAFANGMEYFNTFGGNPVSCAIGQKVLDIVIEEELIENALEIGNYIKSGFKGLQQEFPIIGDVRGHGFFLGWEFIKDSNWTPAADQAYYFVNRAKDYGMLLSTDGPLHNVIKFKPPMIFSKENADYLLAYSEKILKEDFMQL